MQIISNEPEINPTMRLFQSGLQQLVHGKLQQLMQKQQQQQYGSAFKQAGLPEAFGNLNPAVQAKIFDIFAPMIADKLTQQPQQQGMQQLMQQPQQQEISDEVANLLGIKPYNPMDVATKQKLGMPSEEDLMATQLTPEQKVGRQVLKLGKQEEQERINKPEIPQRPRILTKQQLAEQKELTKQEYARQKDIEKKNKAYRDEVSLGLKGSQALKARIDRQKELVKKGNLPFAGTRAIFDLLEEAPIPFTHAKLGINLHSLEGADAAEFNKITKEYTKMIKDFFPGRILQSEVNAFLQTLPDLLQTDEGKWRVLNNMRAFADVSEIKGNVMNKIIREHHGKEPYNLEELVEERSKKLTQPIYDKFIKGNYGQKLEYKGKGVTGALARNMPLPSSIPEFFGF